MRVLGIDTATDVIVDAAAQLRYDLVFCEALILGGSQQASDQFLDLGPTAPHTELLVSMNAVLQPNSTNSCSADAVLLRSHRWYIGPGTGLVTWTPDAPADWLFVRTPEKMGTSADAKCCSSVDDDFSKALAAAPSPSGTSVPATGYSLIPPSKDNIMLRRKPASFRNAIDLKDKVQVKVLRKRLKLSEAQLMKAIRKSGNSIAALVKEAAN